MRRLILLAAAAAVVLVAGGADARRAPAPEPSFLDYGPAFSPDGTRIAFLRLGVTPSRFVRHPSLYTVGADGRGVTALTKSSVGSAANAQLGHVDAITSASWSPDGGSLVVARVYAGTRYDFGHSELWIVDADGSNGRQLTKTDPPEFFRASSPSWSWSRNQIVFAAAGLWRINPDGSGLARLTTDASDSYPAWSPDGSQVAFVRNGKLAVTNAAGTNVRSLEVAASWPAWSPDGSWIAFGADMQGNADIYKVRADDGAGLAPQRLTTDPAGDGTPAWTRNGQSIVFASIRGRGVDSGDLWVMGSDGSNQRLLIRRAPKSAANGRRCTILGTAAADDLRGGGGGDVLCGLESRDKLSGSGGNDILDGGKDKDVLDGGLGNDLILARDGRKDTVRGGLGFDRAQIDPGDDVAGVEKILR